MTDVVRAPDERFEGLPDFPFEPHYREVDGLRLCHLDEGDGQPVVFFHGEPTWSCLWREVIPPVRDAGYRCLAPDYAGFGRSDKPTDVSWYTYDRHTALMASLLEDLDLRDATVVVHDWGGPIGLRLAAEQQDRISRMVVMETGLFTGEQPMSDAWWTFHDFVERTEDFPISLLVRNAVARGMDDEVVEAYDAPFPNKESKAGARAFPLILATSPDMPGAAEGKRAQATLQTDRRPMMVLWADSDPVLPFKVGEGFADLMGVDPPVKIENASHFLQEDAGEEIGRRIADWLQNSP
ncbi:MAG: haloalkane dehalogenase [Solirubrobacterales bacterium]